MLRPEFENTIRQAPLLLALFIAVRSCVQGQTPAEALVTSAAPDDGQELRLPEDPAAGAPPSIARLDLPDAGIPTHLRSDENLVLPNGANAFVQVNHDIPGDKNLKLRLATQESLLFTGIMHTFNLWTEPGTRDTLNGHWLHQYLQSVSELRGWSDSDRFIAP